MSFAPGLLRRRAALATALLLLSASVQADWATVTPEQLARQSELIVVGDYLGQQDGVRLRHSDPPINIGVVRVERWLKGAGGQPLLLLLAPLPRPGGGVSSVDVPLVTGQRGLWYLKKRSDGLYQVDRPERFVPMDAAAARIEALQPR